MSRAAALVPGLPAQRLRAPGHGRLPIHLRQMLKKLTSSLHRFAEVVAAGLLAVIFVAFIVQIALRYLFNWPVGWTAELSVVAWLWLVLWGAAFVLKDHEEIRIDFLSAHAGKRTRIAMGIVGSASIVVLFGMSLPAAYDYVSFMKVEKSSYLNTRFDVLFSIYIIFSVAVIARNLWNLGYLLRGKDPAGIDAAQATAS
jgi:TRAP-type C4-dicarboxylate transport system permease small subunit